LIKIGLGKKFDWRGILESYQDEKEQFSHINCATTSMSQLERMIRSLRKENLLFEDLMLDSIDAKLQNSATRSSWRARREMANVLYTVGKMQWKSNGAMALLVESILNDVNIMELIIGKGNPHDISNTAWACATLGVDCPALSRAVNNKASYLVEQGNSQEIPNSAWAFAQVGYRSTNFFVAPSWMLLWNMNPTFASCGIARFNSKVTNWQRSIADNFFKRLSWYPE
jgi:hypothetical protein